MTVKQGRPACSEETPFASIETLCDEARAGRMFILVDDADRENEGDLVIPACHATPKAINFMAIYGRGLICLTLEDNDIQRLQLSPMVEENDSFHETAFTVSIDLKQGVTTGISAFDRSKTILHAIDPLSSPQDFVRPGHIFPLAGRSGGVLTRNGHTEAAIDLARLAGLHPSGVICEIMRDDGHMARLPDLLDFAKRFDLKIGSIADLVDYRQRNKV